PTTEEEAELPVATNSKAAAATDDDEEEESSSTDEDEETDSGVDPEEARQRFEALKKQLDKAEKAVTKHGRDSKQAEKELNALGDLFKFFKLPPRQFDPVYAKARDVLERVRHEERSIMELCVRRAQMPRKTFIKEFPGNETNLSWIPDIIKKKRDYSDALRGVEEDILRAQNTLLEIEKESSLTLAGIKDINRRMSIG